MSRKRCTFAVANKRSTMKKLIIISILAIFGISMFVFAEQPTISVSDSTKYNVVYKYNEDSTRVDTVRQMAIPFRTTPVNNIKGN